MNTFRQVEKHRSTKGKMEGPMPIKTEQVYNGLYSISATDDNGDRCWVEY
jgi:hypothetical protein